MSARDLALVTGAAAARAHTTLHRKGLAKEPYVNHLTEVAALLAVAIEAMLVRALGIVTAVYGVFILVS